VTALELHYVLRRIRSSREDPELLAKSLIIYHTSTPQLEATASNEIQYWADHYNEAYDDELFLFSLQSNGVVIGYAQCVYFAAQNFVIIDYMTVDEKHKTVGVFLLFYEQIKEYFTLFDFRYDFIVAEIIQESDGTYTQSSEFWRAIMALEDFRVVDAEFHQLQLGRTKYETQLPARLLIGGRGTLTSLRRETYLMIVETILFNHYLRWYKPFQTAQEATDYGAKAQVVFDSIRKAVGARERLHLSPIPGVVLPRGSFNGSYKSHKNLIIFESLSYLLLLIVLIGSTVALQLSATQVLELAIGALLVRMALLSVFVPEARTSLKVSLSALQGLLGNQNSVTRKSTKKPSRKR
jgi:hypothetical protein